MISETGHMVYLPTSGLAPEIHLAITKMLAQIKPHSTRKSWLSRSQFRCTNNKHYGLYLDVTITSLFIDTGVKLFSQ